MNVSTSLQNDEYYFNYFVKARETQKHYEFFFGSFAKICHFKRELGPNTTISR